MNEIIDNFNLIGNYLFDIRESLKEDEFYFLQILVRGKDGNHVSGNNKNRLVKYYIIRSKEQLEDLKSEIAGICELVNGRAYIHPTRRNFKEVANLVLEGTAKNYISQHWIGLRGQYSTACGQSYVKSDKQFIVDLDDFDFGECVECTKFIDTLKGHKDSEGRISQILIPTVHGYHLITNAFDVGEFSKKYPWVDVHKNNPTLLYFNKK